MMRDELKENPYRPSNGTEGSIFESHFCDQCRRGGGREPACSIWVRANAYRVDDPDFPSEWVEDDEGPRCIAFDDARLPPRPRAGFRCRKTKDLFGALL